jgi:hypothetical protein
MLTPKNEMRLFAGLVVQPFLAAAVAFFAFPFLLVDGRGRPPANSGHLPSVTDAAISAALGTGIVALAVTMVFVWPIAVWLTKRRQLSLGDSLLFGLAFGNLTYVLLVVATGWRVSGVASLMQGVAFSSLLGLTSASAFWFLTLRHLPD